MEVSGQVNPPAGLSSQKEPMDSIDYEDGLAEDRSGLWSRQKSRAVVDNAVSFTLFFYHLQRWEMLRPSGEDRHGVFGVVTVDGKITERQVCYRS